jgi:hypothetical protein
MPPLTRYIPLLLLIILLAACSSPATTQASTTEDSPIPSVPLPITSSPRQGDIFSDIPDEARQATRQGDPRPAAYWALWNTCAPDNRAEVAAANGGRASGWFLLDDLIANPGIQIGDYPVTSCEQGLTLLQGGNTSNKNVDDSIFNLAAELLAAELNLNVGAETCPIAEEAVLGGHLVLTGIGFNGTGDYSAISDEFANATPRLVELLRSYNSGELCR